MRHGEVDNPRHLVYADLPGFGLSRTGRSQAREAGRFLASSPIVAVWSSPLQRALETAELIAARHRLPVKVDENLTEWQLSSQWVGVRWEDLPERLPGQLEAYLATPWDLPFAEESLQELAERIAGVARRLADEHSHGDVVIVAHQDPIHAARLHLTGSGFRRHHEDKPDHAEVITLQPGTPWAEVSTWAPQPAALDG